MFKFVECFETCTCIMCMQKITSDIYLQIEKSAENTPVEIAIADRYNRRERNNMEAMWKPIVKTFMTQHLYVVKKNFTESSSFVKTTNPRPSSVSDEVWATHQD